MRSNGEIKWQGGKIFISEVLVGEPVAVEETESGAFRVRFYDLPLGLIDRQRERLCRIGGSVCAAVHRGTDTAAKAEQQIRT